MAGPRETSAPEAQVSLLLNEQPLGTFDVSREFETYTISLPEAATAPLVDDYPVLRLDTATWRPTDWIPGTTDFRDLGVRVDWIEVN
jgi:hypothetical protein